MTIKLFEIRDRATFIPAMAIQVSKADGWLMWRAGFGEHPCVYLIMLATQKAAYDPYDWGNRTMCAAHNYIVEHFDELKTDDVIDVEFILGEKPTKKISERGGWS